MCTYIVQINFNTAIISIIYRTLGIKLIARLIYLVVDVIQLYLYIRDSLEIIWVTVLVCMWELTQHGLLGCNTVNCMMNSNCCIDVSEGFSSKISHHASQTSMVVTKFFNDNHIKVLDWSREFTFPSCTETLDWVASHWSHGGHEP